MAILKAIEEIDELWVSLGTQSLVREVGRDVEGIGPHDTVDIPVSIVSHIHKRWHSGIRRIYVEVAEPRCSRQCPNFRCPGHRAKSQVMYEPEACHLPRWPRVALQEVLVGFQRGQSAELPQSATTLSASGNLRITLEKLIDFPQEAQRD
jgi:hypothetical protein